MSLPVCQLNKYTAHVLVLLLPTPPPKETNYLSLSLFHTLTHTVTYTLTLTHKSSNEYHCSCIKVTLKRIPLPSLLLKDLFWLLFPPSLREGWYRKTLTVDHLISHHSSSLRTAPQSV